MMLSPVTLTLDIGDNITVIYKNITPEEYNPVFDTEDEDLDVDLGELYPIMYKLLKGHLVTQKRMIRVHSMLEFNHFNGTGYCFQDMKMRLHSVDLDITSDVDGYTDFTEGVGSAFSYIYRTDQGYLFIIHLTGPGYGSLHDTHIVMLY